MQPRPSLSHDLRETFKLAAPIGLAQMGHATMSVVDTAVVGRYSASGQGAIALSNGLFFFIAVIGLGVMLGVDPLISQAFGAGDAPRARRYLIQSLWLAVFTGLVLSVPMALTPWVMDGFDISPETARVASWCVWARIPGLIPMLAFSGVRSYLQAAHRSWSVTVAMIVANIANFFIDVALVFGVGPIPALGAVGAAISTTLCTVLQLAIIAYATVKAAGPGKWERPDREDLKAATRVGLPVGLQMAAETGVFALAGLLAARMGDASVAAHQVVLTWASLTFCFAIGIGSAGSVRVGRAIGAGSVEAARQAGAAALIASIAFMSVTALGFMVFPGILSKSMGTDPQVLALAIPLFMVAAVFQISDGLQAVGAGILRGAGDTRVSFIANVLGHYAVGLPIAYVLGILRGGGVLGLWWGLSAGLTAVAVGLTWRFFRLTARPILSLSSRSA